MDTLLQSGRADLNRRPLQPHCSALAKLGHAPFAMQIIPQVTDLASHTSRLKASVSHTRAKACSGVSG